MSEHESSIRRRIRELFILFSNCPADHVKLYSNARKKLKKIIDSGHYPDVDNINVFLAELRVDYLRYHKEMLLHEIDTVSFVDELEFPKLRQRVEALDPTVPSGQFSQEINALNTEFRVSHQAILTDLQHLRTSSVTIN